MSYVGNKPALNYVNLAVQHFTTSATTSYTLNQSVSDEVDIALFINNVRQQPGSSYAYTASGTTLTLSQATAGSDTMYCVFLGKAVETVNPPAGSVNTSELVDNAVTTAKITSDSVTYDKIQDIGTANRVLGGASTGTVGEVQVVDAMTNFVSTSSAAGLQIKGDGTTDGTLQLNCSQNSHGIKIKSPAHSAGASYTLTMPTTDGNTSEFLQTNGSGVLTWADAGGGKILQVVSGTDNTQYSITTNSVSTDYAGSTAFTITPSATSSKIMINFFVGQVMSQNGSGLRFRIYRQIGGSGGFTNVTALGGADSGNRKGAVAGNFGSHTDGEDENRSRTLGGTVVDSPNTTSAVEYKLYYGSGDTTPRSIHVNRTRGDSNNYYTNRTITHVTLLEVGA